MTIKITELRNNSVFLFVFAVPVHDLITLYTSQEMK